MTDEYKDLHDDDSFTEYADLQDNDVFNDEPVPMHPFWVVNDGRQSGGGWTQSFATIEEAHTVADRTPGAVVYGPDEPMPNGIRLVRIRNTANPKRKDNNANTNSP